MIRPLALIAAIVLLILTTGAFGASELVEATPEKVAGATTVDAAQAKALFDDEAVFVDLRKENMWNSGRIPGAIWLDFKTNFSKESLATEVGKDEKIVFYCSGVRCPRSSKAAIKAVEWGYEQVYYFRDGFPAWKNANYPVE
jgi:rhodanese-related sulfurtransferase